MSFSIRTSTKPSITSPVVSKEKNLADRLSMLPATLENKNGR